MPRDRKTKVRINTAIFEELRSRILSGEFKPGDWFSVETLCEEFEVSRQPVMEAMRRLSGDWLVEIVPQVGCRVAVHDRQAVVDYIVTFGEMESHVAALAAERRTQSQLDRLKGILDELLGKSGMDPRNRELAREFHKTVLEMAASPLLARLCAQVSDFGIFAYQNVTDPNVSERFLEQRAEVLTKLFDAIEEGNTSAARKHMATWRSKLAREQAQVLIPR